MRSTFRVLSLAFSLGFLAAWAAASQRSERAEAAGAASPRIQVGQEAPDFTLRGPEGSCHTLGELRGKKNLVLIFFRGTW